MSSPTISFQELEALHDVLEAARCYWHSKDPDDGRATETLQRAHRLYWRIAEELPKTGEPSARFAPVMHSSHGSLLQQLLHFIERLCGEYNTNHDPWFADTIMMSETLFAELSDDDQREFQTSLGRLGLTLERRSDYPHKRISASRRDLGPWAADGDL